MGELDHLGEELLKACSIARDRLTLCAPFVKASVFQRVLDVTCHAVEIELFTRWRPDEVAAGVSDTEVLVLAEERGGTVLLCDRLHAKFVRFDDRTLLGSANLTATALGWTARPNLELLTEVASDTLQLVELDQALRRESVRATAELAAEVERVAALLPRISWPDVPPSDESQRDVAQRVPWLPALREPLDLYVAYSSGLDGLARRSAAAAASDLAALELPLGLDSPQFDAVVASRLIQNPVVQIVDTFVLEPRRFGAVRDLLAQELSLQRNEADFAWQTLMRWLLAFLPERYEVWTANYSEIFARRDARQRDAQ